MKLIRTVNKFLCLTTDFSDDFYVMHCVVNTFLVFINIHYFQKTNIWQEICKEIPKEDYLSLEEKLFISTDNSKKYEILFRNWYSWKHKKKKTVVQESLKIINSYEITCVKLSGIEY